VKRLIPILVLTLFAFSAWADGMVFPSIAYPAHVTIPDQQALIHYTNGTERLVIETRFTGEGTNFAWVLPLPAAPVIESASTGVFPTLQHLFRPRVTHEVKAHFLWILILIGCVLLLRTGRPAAFVVVFIIGWFTLAYIALFSHTLSRTMSASKSMGFIDWRDQVNVLERRVVGSFETATISSQDPQALEIWLRVNGFGLPPKTQPVLASYIKDGWVFVATKVRRDDSKRDTSTPQPLSFTFKTDKPVYPMRLTGVENDSLKVDLYVFGSAQARARHFNVARCTQPIYSEVTERQWYHGWDWVPEKPVIAHPVLHKWLLDSPVATKLTATLSKSDMREDVWIDWEPFVEKKPRLYSASAARTIALNLGSLSLALGLVGATLISAVYKGDQTKRPRPVRVVLVGSVTLAMIVFLVLPKTDVRIVLGQRGSSSQAMIADLNRWLVNTTNATPAVIRTEIERLLVNPRGAWRYYAEADLHIAANDVQGGRIHEEDSPGNYVVRGKSNGHTELLMYDARGAELQVCEWPAAGH